MGSDLDLLEMSVLPGADSVDHNTITIDGKCSFHGMGVKTSITHRITDEFSDSAKQATELNTRNKTKFVSLRLPVGKACLL